MVAIDPFARTDALDDGVLEALATRFETRGRHPGFARMLDEYLAAMTIADGAVVLDLGCGMAACWASAIDVYRRLIATSGAITEGDAEAWAAALRADSAAGVFFGSCNYYAYVARRPAADPSSAS